MPQLKGPVPQVQAKEGPMPQLVKKRRSGWALLAVSALVASLFAVGAAPAHGDAVGAANSKAKASHTTKMTACSGPALADHGFTDLGSLKAAVPNINCLAYYGISAGKTADTFDPNTNVTRGQMALFLAAAAKLMGVDLMGGDMMADFDDIAELGENRRNAITSLARNGIMSGSGGNFRPHDDITRAEMAVALVALLDHTPGAPVKKNKAGEYLLGPDPGTRPNDHFADARSSQPRHIDDAISAAYELGITSGRTADTFDPGGSVPRRNMATFIVNALAHSNLRPAGVTAFVDGAKITVSVRDADFAPVVNQPVDAFMADVAHESRAFKADGTCSSRTSLIDGGSKCLIDGGDPVTETNGNVELASITNVGDGKTVWVWIGDLGDKFGDDTDVLELSVEKGAEDRPAADAIAVSTDLAKQPGTTPPADVTRVHFGTTVTVTLQLKGGTPAKDADPPAGDPTKYNVLIEWIGANDDDLTDNAAVRSETVSVTIGSDGSATFEIDDGPGDSDVNNRGNTMAVRYTLPITEGINAAAIVNTLVFSDEAPAVTYITVNVPTATVAPGGHPAVANTAAVIKVLDQFGKPFRGAPIRLFTNNPTGDNDNAGSTIGTRPRVSNSSGTLRFPFSYSGGASQETLVAMWDGYSNAGTPDDTADDLGASGFAAVAADGSYTCEAEANGGGADVCGDTKVNWVEATRTAAITDQATVLSIDTDNDQIVVDLSGGDVDPTSINYDSTDNFQVADTSETTTSPVSIGDFEEAITTALKNHAADRDGVAAPTLVWSSYVHDDASDIALFTVTVP